MILMMFVLSIGFLLLGAQNVLAQDADGDGVSDARDNCRNTPNPEIIAFTFNYDIWVGNSNAFGAGFTNVSNHPSVDQDPKISPDGTKVVLASSRDGRYEIYVVNVDGSNLHRVTSTVLDETEPVLSPDGSKIVFHLEPQFTANDELWVMNAGGAAAT